MPGRAQWCARAGGVVDGGGPCRCRGDDGFRGSGLQGRVLAVASEHHPFLGVAAAAARRPGGSGHPGVCRLQAARPRPRSRPGARACSRPAAGVCPRTRVRTRTCSRPGARPRSRPGARVCPRTRTRPGACFCARVCTRARAVSRSRAGARGPARARVRGCARTGSCARTCARFRAFSRIRAGARGSARTRARGCARTGSCARICAGFWVWVGVGGFRALVLGLPGGAGAGWCFRCAGRVFRCSGVFAWGERPPDSLGRPGRPGGAGGSPCRRCSWRPVAAGRSPGMWFFPAGAGRSIGCRRCAGPAAVPVCGSVAGSVLPIRPLRVHRTPGRPGRMPAPVSGHPRPPPRWSPCVHSTGADAARVQGCCAAARCPCRAVPCRAVPCGGVGAGWGGLAGVCAHLVCRVFFFAFVNCAVRFGVLGGLLKCR